MLARLQIADIGFRSVLRLKAPRPDEVSGLLDARVGLMARFTDSIIPDPVFGRAMALSFWEDDAALDAYEASGAGATSALAGGWSLRMEPMRGHGAWPGFPAGVDDHSDYTGPIVVTTIGLLRIRRSMAWQRASNKVQKQFLDAQGVIWAMGATRPPYFAATVTVWESAAAAASFAREPNEAHFNAMGNNARDPYMRQELFARFRPLSSAGQLGPRPALAESWLADRIG